MRLDRNCDSEGSTSTGGNLAYISNEKFQEELEFNRDDPTPYVCLELPISRLGCSVHTRKITERMREAGWVWESVKATENIAEAIPDERGLYMFVWEPALTLRDGNEKDLNFRWVLYVGKAGAESDSDLRARYKSEYKKYVGGHPGVFWEPAPAPPTRESLLRFHLALRPLFFYYSVAPSGSADISTLERRLIQIFRPPANTQHKGVLRKGKPEAAF